MNRQVRHGALAARCGGRRATAGRTALSRPAHLRAAILSVFGNFHKLVEATQPADFSYADVDLRSGQVA